MMTKLPLLLFVMLLTFINDSSAQTGVDMADIMRSDGKIYVVVSVAAIVMIGILVYLVLLDRKIGSMEKKIKEKA